MYKVWDNIPFVVPIMANPDSLHQYGSPTINGDSGIQVLIPVGTIAEY